VGDLTGKVAVVTGASRGIGKAIARAVAAAGARAVLIARSEAGLAETQREIESAGGAARYVVADLADPKSLAGVARSMRKIECQLDILVSCAGIGVFKPLLLTSTDEWDRVMAINARAPFLLARVLVPIMNTGGCIINVSSVVGVKGYANQGAYTASKHALMGMTKVLAQELQPRGIRVYVICPGGVDTDMVAQARPDLDRSVLMRPEEIAKIAMFLIDQEGMAVIDQINVRRSASAPWF